MRSIKRTRQIEDLVIEKLGKRGYLPSREAEQSADFVKNLILDESIDMMTKRNVNRGDNVLLNRAAIFETDKAMQEFERFVRLDGALWLMELRQIVQIHLAYKMMIDTANMQLVLQLLDVKCGTGMFLSI